MQSYAQLTQVHATNMQNLASASQMLYISFTAQQKQRADGVFGRVLRQWHHTRADAGAVVSGCIDMHEIHRPARSSALTRRSICTTLMRRELARVLAPVQT